MVAARLEVGFVAIARPAAELAIPRAVSLLQGEASRIFRTLRIEIPQLAHYETHQALNSSCSASPAEPSELLIGTPFPAGHLNSCRASERLANEAQVTLDRPHPSRELVPRCQV
jgi:hypothetical protein